MKCGVRLRVCKVLGYKVMFCREGDYCQRDATGLDQVEVSILLNGQSCLRVQDQTFKNIFLGLVKANFHINYLFLSISSKP